MSKNPGKDYGLCENTPALCGDGFYNDPGSAERYLSRLRCPKGKAVRCTFGGLHMSGNSTIFGLLSVKSRYKLEGKEAVFIDALGNLPLQRNDAAVTAAIIEMVNAKAISHDILIKSVSIHRYGLECASGEHKTDVWLDTCKRGKSLPISEPGWSLADEGTIVLDAECDGISDMHIAAGLGDEDTLREQTAKCSDSVRIRDDRGRTPLHIAALNGQRQCAVILLEAGADINAQDNNGVTPLGSALNSRRPPMLSFLLESGADPEIRDKDEKTALISAVLQKNPEAVSILLEHKADQHAKWPWQTASAVELSGRCECPDVVRIFDNRSAQDD